MKMEVKDFKFRSHMSLSNAGIRIDAGIIVWEGNPINGKMLVREVYTKKSKSGNYGKGQVSFFIDEEKSPGFKTIEDFVKHYTIPPPKPPEPSKIRVTIKPEALAKRKKELENKIQK